MYYIVGRKLDQKIVQDREISSEVFPEDLKNAIAKNYGGTSSGYSVYSIDDAAIIKKIQSGSEWVAAWSDTSINADIIGIDFSAYESKYLISFESDVSEIDADGSSISTITIKFIDNSNNDIFDSIDNIYIPVQSPICNMLKKVNISNGSVKYELKTTTAGEWKFPVTGTLMINGFRVKNQLTINALLV